MRNVDEVRGDGHDLANKVRNGIAVRVQSRFQDLETVHHTESMRVCVTNGTLPGALTILKGE